MKQNEEHPAEGTTQQHTGAEGGPEEAVDFDGPGVFRNSRRFHAQEDQDGHQNERKYDKILEYKQFCISNVIIQC